VPIYEYQCGACNHKFEILQKLSDALLETCPQCEQKKLRKLVTAAAFRLKGTGWYETDFKDKKPTQTGKSEEKPGINDKDSKKGDSSDSTGKDSKPASNVNKKAESKTASVSKKPDRSSQD